MGSLSEFEENVGPLLRGHPSAGKGIGGIGFLKGVENADYFLHNLNFTPVVRVPAVAVGPSRYLGAVGQPSFLPLVLIYLPVLHHEFHVLE